MEENKPLRANKANLDDRQEQYDEPGKARRSRSRSERNKPKRAAPVSVFVILQRAAWGGLFGLVVFDYVRYQSLLQRKENTVMQEISLSGIFLVEVLITFVAAFALCQVLKLWEPKEPVEVLVKQKDDSDVG